jgi:hypothetical protein
LTVGVCRVAKNNILHKTRIFTVFKLVIFQNQA